MSIWTDGLPAWWAMVVAVAALLAGVWLGELHGRGVGRGQVREDRAAERAVRQVRSWRGSIPPRPGSGGEWRLGRGERTAAFLNPPEVHHERQPMCVDEQVCCVCGDPKVVYHNYRDQPFCDPCSDGEPSRYVRPEVAHEWSEHVDQALDVANDDPTVSAWTQQMAESMDAFLAGLLAEHPVPYLPGEEDQ
jgi:hypothetical protein